MLSTTQGELERAQLRESVRALKSEIELEEGNHTVAAAALATAHAAVVAGLQTVVSQKEGQVNEALDKLTDANVALQERDFVISAQRRAEQALAVHGTELAVELQVSHGIRDPGKGTRCRPYRSSSPKLLSKRSPCVPLPGCWGHLGWLSQHCKDTSKTDAVVLSEIGQGGWLRVIFTGIPCANNTFKTCCCCCPPTHRQPPTT